MLTYVSMKKRVLITVNEAAKLKGVTRQAVRAAIDSGRLKARRVKVSTFRITTKDLDAWTPNPNMQRAGRRRNGLRDAQG